ncbi:hypothetical protein, partial [Saccharothrix sp. Mg75]|uniref:hypothetical protein n=1 Tax=Saccharothrix sp. Mg75 TaxID=3445357 RepID=UPI003EE9EC04
MSSAFLLDTPTPAVHAGRRTPGRTAVHHLEHASGARTRSWAFRRGAVQASAQPKNSQPVNSGDPTVVTVAVVRSST